MEPKHYIATRELSQEDIAMLRDEGLEVRELARGAWIIQEPGNILVEIYG
jgi:hypothetical protein